MTIHDLSHVNASLNAMSGILLLVGYILIRRRRIETHRKVMIAAFITSSIFLVCYVVYHAQVGSVPFTRQGFVRPLYFTILVTHVTLAAAVVDVNGKIKAVQPLPVIKNLKAQQVLRKEARIRVTVLAPTDRVVFFLKELKSETDDWKAVDAEVAELIKAAATRFPVP